MLYPFLWLTLFGILIQHQRQKRFLHHCSVWLRCDCYRNPKLGLCGAINWTQITCSAIQTLTTMCDSISEGNKRRQVLEDLPNQPYGPKGGNNKSEHTEALVSLPKARRWALQTTSRLQVLGTDVTKVLSPGAAHLTSAALGENVDVFLEKSVDPGSTLLALLSVTIWSWASLCWGERLHRPLLWDSREMEICLSANTSTQWLGGILLHSRSFHH